MASPRGMDDKKLASMLDDQISNAREYDASELSSRREKALAYFEGELDIKPMPGRSEVVSRDVADAHGFILPGLMRVFLASDRLGIYEPRKPGDEAFAKQATDYVNYVLLDECHGKRHIRDAIHDGLLLANGPIKVWWDASPRYETETYTGLEEDAYLALANEEDVEETVEHSEREEVLQVPQMTEQGVVMVDVPLVLHDCKVRRVVESGRMKMRGLPPEDLLLARSVLDLNDEATVPFVAHRSFRTRSEMIEQGYDRKTVEDLPTRYETDDNAERDARNAPSLTGDDAADKSMEEVEVFECYILADYDGDGIAERRKVVMAGGVGERHILENEEWGDPLPFADLVPEPVPHRWRGRSLFDELEEVQKIKTVLTRQALDNLYASNVPQRAVRPNAIENLDALIDQRFGEVILANDPDAIKDLAVPFVADKTFPILAYFDEVASRRTGISSQSVQLDMEALQNQTAAAVQAGQSAAHTKVEEYARNIADGGLKRLFQIALQIHVKHQDRPRTIRLRGDWVEMNPSQWSADMDVTINVGLGSGSRDRDLQYLAGIAASQKEIIMTLGPSNPIVPLNKYLDTMRMMVEASGIRAPERFFPEVDDETLQQFASQQGQQPDPAMAKAQADMQIAQAKLQMDMQAKQAEFEFKAQLEQAKAQADVQAFRERAELEMQLEREKAAANLQIARDKAVLDAQLKREELAAEIELKRMSIQAGQMSPDPTNVERPQ